MNRPDELLFRDSRSPGAEPAEGPRPPRRESWKVLVVDDEEEVHRVTRLVLSGFSYDERPLQFLSAYSGAEARKLLEAHPDTAVILLDVVMEDYDSGLKLVRHIREELRNRFVRIILRTGQPGHAPEGKVIVEYDINDYKEKTEITAQKLVTAMVAALRTYRDMLTIEANRKGLEKILAAASDIFRLGSLEKFVSGVLTQLASLLNLEGDAFYGQASVFAATAGESGLIIRAASGKFERYMRQNIQDLPEEGIRRSIDEALTRHGGTCHDGGHVEYFESKTGSKSIIYFEECRALSELDRTLVDIFFANVSIGFDNIALNEAAEEKARIAEEALRQAEKANREVLRQTAQRVESLQKISRAVSHQLRNPMTIIAGFAKLLRGKPEVGERYTEYLDGIVAASARIERIAAAVQDYSAIHLGERRQVFLPDLLADARGRAEAKAAELSVTVNWELRAEPLRVSLDPGLMIQALLEVLTNAMEALEGARGDIRLVGEPSGDFLRLTVTDNGRGIPESELAYILDPFYSTKAVGIGMGLVKASRIIQEHGGTLAVTSAPGAGTTVEMLLPLATAGP